MKFKDLIKSKDEKKLLLAAIFILAFFILFFVFVVWQFFNLYFNSARKNFIENRSETVKEESCSGCVRRKLDGVYVEAGKDNLFPAAVMIENYIDSRPQSGLAEANIVFEAEAEGYITRFLAVFADVGDIKEIGPVRSARPYFIDWSSELAALFVHVGGSPEALAQIYKENILDLNEFYQGEFFWRDKIKEAPHNVFISGENIKEYLDSKGIDEGNFFGWKFKDDAPFAERPSEGEITVNFLLPEYVVKWKYNKEANDYLRYNGGDIHKDREGREIKAKNIIIEYVKAEVIDELLRLKMDHVGEGKAIVCLDGKCEEGKWDKNTAAARTRFYKLNGEEFIFNAGATWIEVVRPDFDVFIK
jgi:hypothetical protein